MRLCLTAVDRGVCTAGVFWFKTFKDYRPRLDNPSIGTLQAIWGPVYTIHIIYRNLHRRSFAASASMRVHLDHFMTTTAIPETGSESCEFLIEEAISTRGSERSI